MLERTALYAGEHCRVDELAHHLDLAFGRALAPRVLEVLAHEYYAAARPTEALVRGGRHDVRVLHGVLQQSCGDESCRVCHVYHEQCAHLVGYGTHALIVPLARVCGAAAYYQLGFVLNGESLHLVVVYTSRLLVERVCHGMVQYAAGVDAAAVAEVSAHRQVETHERVAGIEHGEHHCGVGLCAAVRLHVGKLGVKELLHALYGEVLYLVYHAATAVVAFARQSLGVLVGAV